MNLGLKLNVTNLYLGIIGAFIGLMIMNNSLRTMLYVNPMYFLFSVVVFGMLCTKNKDVNIFSLIRVHLNKIDVFLLIVTVVLCLFAIFSTLINELFEFTKLVEILILPILYVIGRKINKRIWQAICFTILIIGTLSAVTVITQRSYIYSSGVNYLLISLGIGLSACVSLLFFNTKQTNKFLYLMVYLICVVSLLSVQSRFVFLFVVSYSLICYLACNFLLKKYLNLLFALLVFLILSAYFLDFIVNIYNNSQIFNRMSSLFFNFNNEPRFETYQLYFEHISEFHITGYGTGGTFNYVYKAGVLRDTYPHNLFLEFYSEFGLLGILFSGSIMLTSIYRILTNRCLDSYYLAAVTFFIFYFSNFMKSFSIYDSSILFLACGIISNKIFIKKRHHL